MTKKRLYFLGLIFLFLLAFGLRFYHLGQVPLGLYQDETAIGYNAFSILKTARDEHGQFLPLYFKSFGDYKSPLYIYLTVISVKLFGLNAWAVRFPSALFGSLTVILVYFLIRWATNDQRLSWLTALFLALNPWHLDYSRATFEVSLCFFLFVLGALLFQIAFKKKKNLPFILGTICLTLPIYAYNLTRLLAPIFLFIFLIYHRSAIRQLPRKVIWLTLGLVLLICVPFGLTLFSPGGIFSAGGTLLFSSAVIQAKILEFRSYLISLPFGFTSLFFNRWIQTLWQYLLNLIGYLSVDFFFVSGSPHGNHGIGNFGQFYPFELPLIVWGILMVLKKKPSWFFPFGWWGMATIAVASLTREAPQATRSFFLILPGVLLSAYGLLAFLDWVKKQKKSLVRLAAMTIFLAVGVYALVFYFTSYYFRFPILYAPAWRASDQELALYLQAETATGKRVIIDDRLSMVYSSLLFYQAYPPEEFQTTVSWSPEDSEGFSLPQKYGPYEFKSIGWSVDYYQKDTLLVVRPEDLPTKIPVLKEIFYPTRPAVYAVKQRILSQPVQEGAYVIVQSIEE
jgi:4-amino-4-deoxy-L-arabinose transferase-like glycosyltransferase